MEDIFDRISGRPDLQHTIDRIGIPNTGWLLLERRAVLRCTLQEIADAEGVTRERIRQKQKRFIERIQDRINMIAHALSTLEYANHFAFTSSYIDESSSTRCGFIAATDWYQNQFVELGWTGVSCINTYRLLIAVRMLTIEQPTMVASRWPKLSFAVSVIVPRITAHPLVQAYVQEQARLNRKLSYAELAEIVLIDALQPLHWHEIADRAEELNRRDSFNPTALYNAISSKPEVFVRVGTGTYGLAEWGLEQVESYGDIFADAMLSECRTMTISELTFRAITKRVAKASSIQMTLDMNARFYKSQADTYGLRAWLPPRQQQTLRTPAFLVETRDSFSRLDRAQDNGYNIQSIIHRDRKRMEEEGVSVEDIWS